MQISNQSIVNQKTNAQVQVSNSLTRPKNESKDLQSSDVLSANKQQSQIERLAVDEKAIAVVEQDFQRRANTSSNSGLKLSVQSAGNESADYDKPSSHNQGAVAAYQSVGNLAQRESVQQIFGVDLFA